MFLMSWPGTYDIHGQCFEYPGDVVLDLSSMTNQTIKLGGGLRQFDMKDLSIVVASGKAGEFGALKEGYMFECSTGLSRMLLSSPTCPVLDTLGKKLSFEIAVGLNGRIWVNASSPSTTIIVANALRNSEPLSGVQQKIMAEKLLQRVQ
ncbi:hypothetical protein TSUD_53690 [Trifolium subterraneum]|uniref:K Homology domain-containing protein n=1 Tax=Trifolium subterraneum TaxID=3900 RepID=A0A2Z6N630_TRISU|nr:hypothetical protein TSUD_53690 [Trifolium subterraneum]